MIISKQLVWVLVAGVVVGGGYYMLTSTRVADTTGGAQATQEPTGKKMAFGDFMKQGGSYKCAVQSNSAEGINTTGTIYLNASMIRVDASTKMPGSSDIKTSIIVTTDYTYTWTAQAGNTGFKTKTVQAAGDSASYGFDASQIGDYTCDVWSADASVFVPPANVVFSDVSAGN